jgi:ArsR family transcriptional regulator
MEISVAAETMGSLAHVARLQILALLARGTPNGVAAGEIAARLGLPPATLSFHLKELARARLVSARRNGRNLFYTANSQAIRLVAAYLAEQLLVDEVGEVSGGPKPTIRAKIAAG